MDCVEFRGCPSSNVIKFVISAECEIYRCYRVKRGAAIFDVIERESRSLSLKNSRFSTRLVCSALLVLKNEAIMCVPHASDRRTLLPQIGMLEEPQ